MRVVRLLSSSRSIGRRLAVGAALVGYMVVCRDHHVPGIVARASQSAAQPPAVQRAAGAPEGEVLKGEFTQSQVYPGTWREYWVYVPKQLDRAKAAPVMVFQDGIQYSASTVSTT